MSGSVTAVQFGVGPIGSRIVRSALDRDVEFVGALDVDPEKVGTDLGTAVDRDPVGVTITDDEGVLAEQAPDVVFHSTHSSLSVVQPQLETAMAAGADVVSTTESLSYPWWANDGVATELDEFAREQGVTCIGTGVNPGFVMDTLPAFLSTPCESVASVRVERVQDAGSRRRPLQEKVGAGRTVEAFESEVAEAAGHVGLPESVAMLADALGWSVDAIDETIEPVVAERDLDADVGPIAEGDVAGIAQTATGTVDGRTVVELDLRMYVGAEDPHDRVEFTGDPDVAVTVEGGYHGDVATSAVVTNIVPRVRAADPGLATMLDLQVPSCSR